MKLSIACGWMVILMLLMFNKSFSQSLRESQQEAQIPLSIQTFFYGNYNNIKEVNWSLLKSEGDKYYESSFIDSNNEMKAIFEINGTLKQECKLMKKPSLSAEIKFHIDLNYSKFKVFGLKEYTLFKSGGEDKDKTKFYQLIGSSKQKNVSVWFDKYFNELKQSDLGDVILIE